MTEMAYGLGGRLPLLEADKLPPQARSLFDTMLADVVPAANKAGFRSMDGAGHFVGPFNVTVYSPEMCGSFLALQKAEAEHTALSQRVRQVVILSVGSVWKAAYEIYAHSAVAENIGLTNQQASALAAGQDVDELAEDERLAQAFTLELVSTHRVSLRTYRAAREVFGERGLVDMVMLTGCYLTVCALLNAFEIPGPEPAQIQEAKDG